MDASRESEEARVLEEMKGLGRRLTWFLKRFADCVKTAPTRDHLRTYVGGQVSGLPRKSVEPIALAAGIPPRTLQEFLGGYRWDHEAVRRRLHEVVARDHAAPNAMAVIDETTFAKKGDKTAGVQRQWCGATGKKDNCVMTVHVGYAAGDFHALLDSDLYLPNETWHQNRPRCREAGIPDNVVYRPKWQIALDLLDRVMSHGVRFKFVLADEAYGMVPAFRRGVADRGLIYAVEVPCSVLGWLTLPAVAIPPRRSARGYAPRKLRLEPSAPPARRVDRLWKRGGPAWQHFHVKNTDKGPEVWEVRVVRFTPCDDRLPQDERWLLVARHPFTGERKYFLSNAPADTAPEVLIHLAFSRWHIERLFEEGKSHVGLDHFEVRHYLSLTRHLILSMLSLLFLVEQTWRLREKKPTLDRPPSSGGDRCAA